MAYKFQVGTSNISGAVNVIDSFGLSGSGVVKTDTHFTVEEAGETAAALGKNIFGAGYRGIYVTGSTSMAVYTDQLFNMAKDGQTIFNFSPTQALMSGSDLSLSVNSDDSNGNSIYARGGFLGGHEGGGVFTTQLSADGNISGSGQLQIGAGGTFNGHVVAAGNVNATAGNLSCSAHVMAGGNIEADGNVVSRGNISSSQDVYAARNIQADGGVTTGGNLYGLSVNGEATVKTITGSAGSDLQVGIPGGQSLIVNMGATGDSQSVLFMAESGNDYFKMDTTNQNIVVGGGAANVTLVAASQGGFVSSGSVRVEASGKGALVVTGDITGSGKISGSFYGDGANITGISSDALTITTAVANQSFYVPFVDTNASATDETVYIADNLVLNPATNQVQISGSLKTTGTITGDGSGLSSVPIPLAGPDGGTQIQPLMLAASGSRDNGTTTGLFALEGLGWGQDNSRLTVPGGVIASAFSGDGSSLSNVPIALTGPDGGNWIQPMMLAASGSRDNGTTTGLFAQEGLGYNAASTTFIVPGNILIDGNYTGTGSGLSSVPIALTGPDGGNWIQPMMLAASGSRDNGTTTGLFAQEGLGYNAASTTFIVPGNISGSGQVQGRNLNVDSGAINSDGGGNLAATSFGDGTATLQGGNLTMGGGNLTGAGNISGSGAIKGATATFGGIQFQGDGEVRGTAGTFKLGDNDLTTTGTGQFGPVTATTLSASSNVDVAGNLEVDGNLTVRGTTTVISSSNMLIQDRLIGMAFSGSGDAGPLGDRALIMGLTGEDSVALMWDESATQFALVRTTTQPDNTGDEVAIASYVDLRVKSLTGGTTLAINEFTAAGALQAAFNVATTLNAEATMTLPSGPSEGDIIYVKGNANTAMAKPINISGSTGSKATFDGDSSPIQLVSPYGAVNLICIDDTTGAEVWSIY